METAGKTIIREEVFVQLALGAMEKLEVVPVAAKAEDAAGKGQGAFEYAWAPDCGKKIKKTGRWFWSLGIAVPYGTFIPEVASRIRRQVAEEIRQVACWEVERIDVLVERLLFPATPGKEDWPEMAIGYVDTKEAQTWNRRKTYSGIYRHWRDGQKHGRAFAGGGLSFSGL